MRLATKGVPRDRVRALTLELVETLNEKEVEEVLHDWDGLWARPEQLVPPGDWLFWLNLAGRGFGKTRVGAETTRKWSTEMPGSRGFIAARTIADARDTCIEGESGLLSCLPESQRPPHFGEWNRSKGELWLGPDRELATYIKLFSSEEPDSGRGPQFHWGWADELAAWLKGAELWDQLLLGLRLPWPGRQARAVITTTPKPLKVVRDLLKHTATVVTRGTTYDNLVNLSPAFRAIIVKFEGTRIGRQELRGELLDDVPGALWTRTLLDGGRLAADTFKKMAFDKILVGVDPATTSNEGSDETGIVVAGRSRGKRYTLEDCSLRGKPVQWATAAVDAYHRWKADGIVAESNQGGEMVEGTISAVDKHVPVHLVHASRGKRTRAEPIATAYERGDVKHLGGFEKLEDQMCTWVPGEDSPDRMDALVWVMTELGEGGDSQVPSTPGPPQRTGLGAGRL